jgi:hypothetical protein
LYLRFGEGTSIPETEAVPPSPLANAT